MGDAAHLDPDTLTALALGEFSPHMCGHLQTCSQCVEELAALRYVVQVGRSLDPNEAVPVPPAGVWERVRTELDHNAPPPRPHNAPPPRPHNAPPPRPHNAPPPRPRNAPPPPGEPRLRPHSARARRRRLAASGVLAAAVAVAVLGVFSLNVHGQDRPTEVAAIELAPLVGVSQGQARLVQHGDELRLQVDIEDLPERDGYYELWLLTSDEGGLVSLGPVAANRTYPIPPGLDPSEFPVVDVSAERFDGDPTHSGDSILRGTLPI